jgi:hypothetical protein
MSDSAQTTKYHPLARVIVQIAARAIGPGHATLDILGAALIAVGIGMALEVAWGLVAAGVALIMMRVAQEPPS